MIKNIIVYHLLALTSSPAALSQKLIGDGTATARMRVIVDNDFSGDPDGLFQLAHILLSPSVDVRAVIVLEADRRPAPMFQKKWHP